MSNRLFDPGNLTQPYHSINTDVHKRIRYLEANAGDPLLAGHLGERTADPIST